jgi:hypothetical protein
MRLPCLLLALALAPSPKGLPSYSGTWAALPLPLGPLVLASRNLPHEARAFKPSPPLGLTPTLQECISSSDVVDCLAVNPSKFPACRLSGV